MEAAETRTLGSVFPEFLEPLIAIFDAVENNGWSK